MRGGESSALGPSKYTKHVLVSKNETGKQSCPFPTIRTSVATSATITDAQLIRSLPVSRTAPDVCAGISVCVDLGDAIGTYALGRGKGSWFGKVGKEASGACIAVTSTAGPGCFVARRDLTVTEIRVGNGCPGCTCFNRCALFNRGDLLDAKLRLLCTAWLSCLLRIFESRDCRAYEQNSTGFG